MRHNEAYVLRVEEQSTAAQRGSLHLSDVALLAAREDACLEAPVAGLVMCRGSLQPAVCRAVRLRGAGTELLLWTSEHARDASVLQADR